MAKSKHQHRYPVTRTAAAGTAAGSVARGYEAPLDLKDYVLLNALFDGFCVVQLIVVRLLLPDMLGLYFFFGFIMMAFLMVSAFDYMTGRFSAGVAAPDKAEQS
jgi:hypothetical protein